MKQKAWDYVQQRAGITVSSPSPPPVPVQPDDDNDESPDATDIVGMMRPRGSRFVDPMARLILGAGRMGQGSMDSPHIRRSDSYVNHYEERLVKTFGTI